MPFREGITILKIRLRLPHPATFHHLPVTMLEVVPRFAYRYTLKYVYHKLFIIIIWIYTSFLSVAVFIFHSWTRGSE